MARTDSLTGLLTQRTFYGLLDKEWRRATRYNLPLSCVMLDIDFFKRINDQHGHPAGDAVLKAVAELLAISVRGSDSVCRYGGEEFCVLLPETTEGQAALWAERVRSKISKLDVGAGGKRLAVTASFGVAQRRDDTQTCEALVDLADQGLLCAKQSGRDRVVAYESLCNAEELDLTAPDKYSGLFRGIAARHVMTPMVFCLHQNETVGRAVEFFLRSRVNSTPVVDVDGKLAGMLSEKDLMSAMVSPDCWSAAVSAVMRPHVICYDEDTPIRTIYEFLCRVSIRRVVITQDDRPIGTISRSTLLRWFRNLVVSQGLVESDDLPKNPTALDVQRSKQRLAETARELALHASRLQQRFQHDAEDLVPFVVGGATQMQELVTDLLAFSRYANDPANGAVSIDSLQFESTHLD
jgi:diguanylate cyclase (GGDEF)-like protein